MRLRPLLSALVAAGLLAACGGAATSLADAVIQRPDEFPPGTEVIVPPSARSPLGHRKADTVGERRISMEIDPCFVVEPRRSPGLSTLVVDYETADALQVELGAMLGDAGLEIGGATRAVLTLRDLVIEEGIGVPDPNTCDFTGDAVVPVATRAIRAGTAELRFAGSVGTRGGISSGAGGPDVAAGWRIEDAERGLIAGSDIVLAATIRPVAVEVAEQASDLGHRISGGQTVPLPGGLDGVIVVERYDVAAGEDGQGLLTVRIESTAGTARAVDGRCDPTGPVALGHARRCLARLGSAALAVWWEKTGAADDPRVSVRARSYRMQAR